MSGSQSAVCDILEKSRDEILGRKQKNFQTTDPNSTFEQDLNFRKQRK